MLRQAALSFILMATTTAATTAARADAPKVVADIAPVHSIVARVMQGVGEPSLLVRPGASPHGYSMRPSEARALSQSQLVVFVGERLTPWLTGPIETLAPDAQRLELLQAKDVVRYDFRQIALFAGEDQGDAAHDDHEGHDDHEKHDDHEDHGAHDDHDDHEKHEDDHEEHGHDDHDHSGLDPHAWMDPENGKAWARAVTAELIRIDPENADRYQENADAMISELDEVSAQMATVLAGVQPKGFIVFHDAYQYLERRFDLQPLGAISLGDGSAPSPARLSELRDAIADSGARCAFFEPQFDDGLIKAVMPPEDVELAYLDPIGVKLELGPGLYPALLKALANNMGGCFAE